MINLVQFKDLRKGFMTVDLSPEERGETEISETSYLITRKSDEEILLTDMDRFYTRSAYQLCSYLLIDSELEIEEKHPLTIDYVDKEELYMGAIVKLLYATGRISEDYYLLTTGDDDFTNFNQVHSYLTNLSSFITYEILELDPIKSFIYPRHKWYIEDLEEVQDRWKEAMTELGPSDPIPFYKPT